MAPKVPDVIDYDAEVWLHSQFFQDDAQYEDSNWDVKNLHEPWKGHLRTREKKKKKERKSCWRLKQQKAQGCCQAFWSHKAKYIFENLKMANLAIIWPVVSNSQDHHCDPISADHKGCTNNTFKKAKFGFYVSLSR